jgi:hypothetical protein
LPDPLPASVPSPDTCVLDHLVRDLKTAEEKKNRTHRVHLNSGEKFSMGSRHETSRQTASGASDSEKPAAHAYWGQQDFFSQPRNYKTHASIRGWLKDKGPEHHCSAENEYPEVLGSIFSQIVPRHDARIFGYRMLSSVIIAEAQCSSWEGESLVLCHCEDENPRRARKHSQRLEAEIASPCPQG